MASLFRLDVQADQVKTKKCAGIQIYNLLKILFLCMMSRKCREKWQNFSHENKLCFFGFSYMFRRILFIYYILYYMHILHILHSNKNFNGLQKAFPCTLPAHEVCLPAHFHPGLRLNYYYNLFDLQICRDLKPHPELNFLLNYSKY